MEGAAPTPPAPSRGRGRNPIPDRGRSRNLKGLRRLAAYLVPYRARAAGALLALTLAALAVLSLGVGVRYLIDGGFAAGHPGALNHALEAVVIVIVVLAVATFFRSYLVTWLAERVVADLRRDVYAHLVRLPPGFFEVTRTGEVVSRLTTDTSVIQAVMATSVTQALRNLLLLLGGVVLLLVTNPRLTALAFVVVPVVVVPLVVIGRRVRGLSRSAQDRTAEVSAAAEETLNAVRTVQAFAQEERESARFAAAAEATFAAAARYAMARALLAAIVITLIFGAIVVVLWVGGQDVLAGRLSAGELSSFVFFAATVASAVGGLSDTFGDLQRAAGASERLFELLDAPSAITAPPSPRHLPSPVRGAVRLEDVAFVYPADPNRPTLDGVDLDVRPGETVALVGPSGAGKTTVFQLLTALLRPDPRPHPAGRRALSRPRPARAAPPHRPRAAGAGDLLGRRLDNIRYGRPEASDAEVRGRGRGRAGDRVPRRACRRASPPSSARSGVRLSGGQRQRIAIARAILLDPPLLLLDEATSALDAESERLVQAALERVMRGRTTLVIAHRLATVLKADRIVVLEAGRIVELGRHEDLLRRGGLYARLAELQFNLDQAA